MYFKPSRLGEAMLDNAELKADKQACKKYGPCGVGQKALYLNTIFLDRRLYVPVSSVKRAYKQIAMSKGGFSGKGVFGSIPYLIVEYDKGKTVKCTFKFEQNLDMMLSEIEKVHPKIKTVSAAGEKRLAKARAEEAKRVKKNLNEEEKVQVSILENARAYLEKKPALAKQLSYASKNKRINQRTSPSYKWVSFAIMLAAAVAAAYGIYCLITHTGSFGLYFLLIGLAFIFLFSGVSVRPTAANNRKMVDADLHQARSEMQEYLNGYPNFPLPAKYAHPACLTRMIRSIEDGRAETVQEAFEDLKTGLKALNADVQVSQTEYDEVVAIKPMFLIEDYM